MAHRNSWVSYWITPISIPLVYIYIPSGYLLHSHGKWSIEIDDKHDDFPIKNGSLIYTPCTVALFMCPFRCVLCLQQKLQGVQVWHLHCGHQRGAKPDLQHMDVYIIYVYLCTHKWFIHANMQICIYTYIYIYIYTYIYIYIHTYIYMYKYICI